MPRCNLTIKQKSQIIDLSGELTTEQLAKKFRVHPTTVTRTLKNKIKILDLASRINVNFKTVQTNMKNEEHDSMVLEFIKSKQEANEPITIKDICDRAAEYAKNLDREIKSRRGWWRRFKVRCNIIKSRLNSNKNSTGKKRPSNAASSPTVATTTSTDPTPARRSTKQQEQTESCKNNDDEEETSVIQKNKEIRYTFKIRETNGIMGLNLNSAAKVN